MPKAAGFLVSSGEHRGLGSAVGICSWLLAVLMGQGLAAISLLLPGPWEQAGRVQHAPAAREQAVRHGEVGDPLQEKRWVSWDPAYQLCFGDLGPEQGSARQTSSPCGGHKAGEQDKHA